METGSDAASNGDLPWASVFDPAANMRALTGIQAEGLRAASHLVDRFIRVAATGLDGAGKSPDPSGADSDRQRAQDRRADIFGATDIEPLLRSWMSMMAQMLGGSAGRSSPESSESNGAALDFTTATPSGRIALEVPAPGVATAEVWLHNLGRSDLGEVTLRCSDLLAAAGGTIEAAAVSIDPRVVPVPARSSRGVDVTVRVADGVPPGCYRGTLLAQRHPQLWLPLAVQVGGHRV